MSKIQKCQYCGESNLKWIKTDHGWRLGNTSGKVHQCSSYKQKPKLSGEITEELSCDREVDHGYKSDSDIDDVQLLALAAKAVSGTFEFDSTTNHGSWNPLENDGDAFRLAVKLKMMINDVHEANMVGDVVVVVQNIVCYEHYNQNAYAATRRAIVRAAAEIGRTMEVKMSDEKRTCPECNMRVINNKCTNPDGCNYRGPGWTLEQRSDAWAKHGVEERSVGAGYGDDYGEDIWN